MSVLYSLTLRRNCAHSKNEKTHPALKFALFFLIAGISFNGAVAQEVSKQEQERKEAEVKKQEAAIMDAKLKANPGLKEKLEASKKLDQEPAILTPEQQQKNEEEEKARYLAKRALEKVVVQNGGVDYKVITSGNQVEYVVTNAGNVIYRHQINSSASLYDRQVQAEKEGLYASNTLRRNLNYPLNALQSEINGLVNAPKINNASRTNNEQRVTADYTFNGSGGTINVSAAATPYPAIITVSGVPSGSIMKEIKINGLNHTWADDVDIILQSPTGTNVVLISDVGGGGADFVNNNYTLNDGAAISMGATVPADGTYKPTNRVGTIGPEPDNWVAPGPGVVSQPTPTLSSFGNGNHNGDWKLFVFDDAGGDSGNWGSWSITFTDPPAVCFPIAITGQPANATVCSGTNGSFTVVATPNGVNYNWQVNTGSGFVYMTNGGVYAGVTTATLSITGATIAMNGYQYRCVLTCTQGGLPEISNPATLTVLQSPSSPAVSPTNAAICPGGSQLIAVGGGAQTTFGGGPGVTIPGTGTAAAVGAPYPSTIAVAGLPAQSLVKSVTLTGVTHTFPGDVDIILKSPSGATVILMSDAGGSDDVNGVTYTFDDAASSLLGATFNASGSYRPTNIGTGDNWPAPGPGTVNQSTPALGSFGAGNNNGNWELYIYDDAGGDVGSISGWSITFEALSTGIFSPATGLFTDAGLSTPYTAGSSVGTVYASPAATTTYGVAVNNGTCNSAPTNVTITVNQPPTITAQPGNGEACVGVVKTLSVTATGTGVTYQWQVDMGSGFVNITTGTPANPSGFIYTGQTTATLSINTAMVTMNGYKYRCVVSGTCLPAVNSNEVTLAVNSLPAIVVTKSAQCAPTSLTASGADTYLWTPSAGLSGTTGATVTANPTANTIYTVTGTNTATGCANTTQVDVKFTPATPVVAPTAPIICAGAVQQLSITSSSGSTAPNTTSSGAISLAVDNLLPPAISNLSVAGVPGAVQSISVNFNITHTFDGDVIINLKAPNGNIFNLVNRRGGGGDNFTNTIISSTSASPVSGGAAPFTGTYSADAANGVGIAPNQSNVTAFSSLFSTANGTWSLIVTDHAGGDVGTLTSWSITLNYAIPDAGIWTPVTGLFTDAAGTLPYVAGTPAAAVYASPAATTTYSVTVTNTSTETRTFSTGGTVTIPGVAPGSTNSGAGAPYPSTVAVSGLPANAVIKSVTVKGIRHSFPDDIDMLLQSPTGINVVLMSDVGGSSDATGQSYTFDDAASNLMADAALNASGTYRPTNFGSSDTYPAPVGSITQATPTLGSFTGDPNGTWNLYVNDGLAGDIGLLSSWEITFTIPDATNCTSVPRTVTVTVQSPIVYTAQPANRSVCQNGSVTFTAAATGTITTTQWQVSTNGGTTWADIAGATTTTLTLANVQPSQNGYRYRLVLSNAGCGGVNSNVAILTVNPLPTVSLSLSPAGQTQLRPGMLTTVTVNSTPAGASYQWFLNGVAQPSILGASYGVDAHHLGTYTVRVTDVNGCVSTTSGVTFTALPTSQLFVYPNPTTGAFYVTYYMPHANTPVTLTVIDMAGRRMMERHEITTGAYTKFDFSNSKLAAGVYIIEFRNPGGDRLAAGQLVVIRD
jgi:subtilisin-like proprotein convertase family protein